MPSKCLIPLLKVFGLREETGLPGKSPSMLRENMETMQKNLRLRFKHRNSSYSDQSVSYFHIYIKRSLWLLFFLSKFTFLSLFVFLLGIMSYLIFTCCDYLRSLMKFQHPLNKVIHLSTCLIHSLRRPHINESLRCVPSFVGKKIKKTPACLIITHQCCWVRSM